LIDDVAPIGGSDLVKYKYVMAVFDKRSNQPVCFVTLENSPFASNVLCVFENNGVHSNHGSLRSPDLMKEFIEKALRLIKGQFHLDHIEEMAAAKPGRQSWWKIW
jgi:hypothetical protein